MVSEYCAPLESQLRHENVRKAAVGHAVPPGDRDSVGSAQVDVQDPPLGYDLKGRRCPYQPVAVRQYLLHGRSRRLRTPFRRTPSPRRVLSGVSAPSSSDRRKAPRVVFFAVVVVVIIERSGRRPVSRTNGVLPHPPSVVRRCDAQPPDVIDIEEIGTVRPGDGVDRVCRMEGICDRSAFDATRRVRWTGRCPR